MGSLIAHVIGGITFLVYGGWWIFASFWLYLTTTLKINSRQTGKYADVNIKSKSYIPVPGCPRVPIEPILKIILGTVQMIIEEFFKNSPNEDGTDHVTVVPWSMYKDDGSFKGLVKLHHMTVNLCFIASGIIDLVSLCIQYPKHTSQLFLSLALLAEGVLFYFHLEDRDSLDVILHQLLVAAIGISFISAVLRMYCATNVLVNATLALSLTLQGTWLIEIGVILYGPSQWDNENHNNRMFVMASFIWHLMLIGVGMFIFYTLLMIALKYCNKEHSRRGEWRNPLSLEKAENEQLLLRVKYDLRD